MCRECCRDDYFEDLCHCHSLVCKCVIKCEPLNKSRAFNFKCSYFKQPKKKVPTCNGHICKVQCCCLSDLFEGCNCRKKHDHGFDDMHHSKPDRCECKCGEKRKCKKHRHCKKHHSEWICECKCKCKCHKRKHLRDWDDE